MRALAVSGEETGINAANEVRRQFRPLTEIAREQRCAILIVQHMNKAVGQKAINRAVGSVKQGHHMVLGFT